MIRKIILRHIKGPEIAYIFPSDDQYIIQTLKPELQKEVETLVHRIAKTLPLSPSAGSDNLQALAENLSGDDCAIQGKPVSAYYFTSGS